MNTKELKELKLQELEQIAVGQTKEKTAIEKLTIKIVTEFNKIFS